MQKESTRKLFQRFDLVVFASILVLSLLIGIVLWHGDQVKLKVIYFSWADRKIGIEDRHFTLTFNRPVNFATVEQNLTIVPPLPGKISATGRTLFYSLTELPIYGINYQLKLQGVTEQYGNQPTNRIPSKKLNLFVSLFSSHDRAFAYLGVKGEERGRLILYNITQRAATILTPRDLIVTNFAIYPDSSRILFTAFDRASRGQGLSQQQLYTVTTGLNFQSSQKSLVGRIERILDAKDYQNLNFDLSANGKTIVIQRVNRRNPAESGLWIIPQKGEARPLGIPGRDFIVAPDGQTVAVNQPRGIGIIPLTPEAGSPQFFGDYEKILGFSRDGSQKLMVKDNADYTRSLFLVDRQGKAEELFKTIHPILNCLFEPRQEQILYCLKTDWVQEAGQFREEPFLSVIDLETAKDFALFALPNYRDVQMSMSPDGVALLFDQVVTTTPTSNNDLLTRSRQAITDGRLWLLPLSEIETDISTNNESPKVLPEELNTGFNPHWLP